MSTQFPKEIELARSYIFFDDGLREHVPPPTHDPVVADARRDNPPHTLVYRNQLLGAVTAGLFFPQLVPDDVSELDKRIGADIAAGAAFGGGRLSFEQVPMKDPRRRPMRRNIHLPVIADREDQTHRLSYGNRVAVTYSKIDDMEDACVEAYVVTRRRPITQEAAKKVGRTAAEAALWMALLPYDHIEVGSPEDVQFNVRDAGMNALKTTEQIGLQLRVHVSLAMLAEAVSPLTARLNEMKAHKVVTLLQESQAAAPAVAAKLLAPYGVKLDQ